MKLANINDRATLVLGDRLADVATASAGRFGPELMPIYDDWAAFTEFAATVSDAGLPETGLPNVGLLNPVPRPRQVFAIGLNYAAHAAESGMTLPTVPATFTKFPSSLGGPLDDVEVVGDTVDWEVELVAVIGRHADRVDESHGWSYVAGLTVGQDISDRTLQFAASGQFSLGKSRRGFGPMGPVLVTPDEFDDPDDLALGCSIDGTIMQSSRTSDLVFSIPRLVAELSAVCPLWPGDVVFTGTPAGVGIGHKPPRFLQPGEVLESWIEGIGTIRNRMVAPAQPG